MASRNNDLRYGCHRVRKTTVRSKAPQGITLKKTNHVEILNFEDEKKRKLESHDDIALPWKKSKIRSNSSPNPEIGEIKPPKKRRSRDVISECGSVDDYDTLELINQGAYGIVYRARNKKSGEIFAMKKEIEGLSTSTLREINILRSLNPHPYIVDFKEVVVDDDDGVYIIMEYLESDLERYMKSRITHDFTLTELKLWIKQLIEGVYFLHKNQIMHRDLKPSNILINSLGNLKICDFGLSRQFGRISGSKSIDVVTLWYRAPELLLGRRRYCCAIDMWSVGCIMAELLLRDVLFKGKSEIDQIDKIFRVLGTPNESVWPGFRSLPGGRAKFVQQPINRLRQKFFESGFKEDEAGFDLLNRLLTYDPDNRITAQSALNHAWFKDI